MWGAVTPLSPLFQSSSNLCRSYSVLMVIPELLMFVRLWQYSCACYVEKRMNDNGAVKRVTFISLLFSCIHCLVCV